MKKITLLTVTALTVTGLVGPALPAQAAGQSCSQAFPAGNKVFISYGSDCNIQNLLDKLESCFPGITLPDCVLPDICPPQSDIPGSDLPETEVPDSDLPEADSPEAETPDSGHPETEAPETNRPDNNTPDTPGNGSTEDTAPESGHAFIQQVVALVNQERAKEGLSPLTINTKVQAAAQVRAVECEQLFSHTRPDGSSFSTALKEQNVSYRSAGENIAWGQHSPEEVMNAWMNSSGHRANIMNPNFTTIGVGYYENTRGTDYWCQLFTR